MKRAFIVHGWGGYPEEGWIPWLKKELEQKGFKVFVPSLPDTDKPRIYKWVPTIIKAVKNPNEETYFVGHSLGCQAIARYLEVLPDGIKVGGAVFVAGFFKRLMGFKNDREVQKTDKHWLTAQIDFKKIKSHLRKSVAIFSDDDPWVPSDNQDDFRNKLGSEILIDHNKKHFSEDDGITEIPIALKSILEISK